MHIANMLKEKELNEISVVKQYLTTAAGEWNAGILNFHNNEEKMLDSQQKILSLQTKTIRQQDMTNKASGYVYILTNSNFREDCA